MKKTALLFAGLLFAVLIGYAGYTAIFPKAPAIALPQAGSVLRVEVSRGTELTTITDAARIKALLACFGRAKATRASSVNDQPPVKAYYTVRFITQQDNLYTTYVYKENAAFKLEQPYHGVYLADKETEAFFPALQ